MHDVNVAIDSVNFSRKHGSQSVFSAYSELMYNC